MKINNDCGQLICKLPRFHCVKQTADFASVRFSVLTWPMTWLNIGY